MHRKAAVDRAVIHQETILGHDSDSVGDHKLYAASCVPGEASLLDVDAECIKLAVEQADPDSYEWADSPVGEWVEVGVGKEGVCIDAADFEVGNFEIVFAPSEINEVEANVRRDAKPERRGDPACLGNLHALEVFGDGGEEPLNAPVGVDLVQGLCGAGALGGCRPTRDGAERAGADRRGSRPALGR